LSDTIAIGLEVAPDLVKLPAAAADDLAGFGHVAEIGREVEQAELAACYLLFRGYVASPARVEVARNTILTPARSGVATPVSHPDS
jgi:hypothetical protein